MAQINLSWPHQLPPPEVRQRVETLGNELLQRYASYVERVERNWRGDVLSFALHRGWQSVTGTLCIERGLVRLELKLPWSLALFASRVQQHIDAEGRRLLAG